MKILVDKVPKREDECFFSEYDGYFGSFLCLVRTQGTEWCVLEKNEECPYLKVGGRNE